jgi:hypothetical protein
MSTALASLEVTPQRSHRFHSALTSFNTRRLSPRHISSDWAAELKSEYHARLDEGHFIESERRQVRAAALAAPVNSDAFLTWYEALRECGPGQSDPLFPWLETAASLEEMRWFLSQEAAGEAGFDDLVALTQVKFPVRAKLEMARNYWDEMGRGHERGMHGPMLGNTVRELDLHPNVADTTWEALALANLMVGLAANRRYAYHAIGALGVIEMTAPGRVSRVNAGLKRLQVPTSARMYFQLQAGLDVEHSKSWNAEVIGSLVAADPRVAHPIAEGALMRLNAGARCFRRYREHFRLDIRQVS